MPKISKNRFGETTTYEKNELPTNVKRFMNELEKNGLTGIDYVLYNVFVPNTDLPPDEIDEPYNDLDISVRIDAEEAAQKPVGFDRKIKKDADELAQYFGIDSVYIYLRHEKKDEFAKKFLKQLKAHLKTLPVSDAIHSIGFNFRDNTPSELKITKKRDAWHRNNRDIKQDIVNYLESLGFPNIKIYFVN